jgi:tyrosinase
LKKDSKADQPSRYDEFVQCHHRAAGIKTLQDSGGLRSQPHFGPAFLPWHRLFIYEFEKALGDAMKDDSFGLPYWDWAATNEAERFEIFQKTALAYMGGDRIEEKAERSGSIETKRFFVTDGPFKDWYQWRSYQNPTPPGGIRWDRDLWPGIERGRNIINSASRAGISETITKLANLLKRNEYDKAPWLERNKYLKANEPDNDDEVPFRPQLEGNFHDAIHKWVGGGMPPRTWGMGSLASPNDPIFYLHHGNLDRLWALWQGYHGIHKYAPVIGGPPLHNLDDNMEGLPAGSQFVKPADALDYYGKLGYKYDNVAVPRTSSSSTPPASHLGPHPIQPQNAALANRGAATPGLPAQHQQANIVHNNALV